MWKLEFLSTTFAVILVPLASSIIPKAELHFKVIMYILLSPGSCFKSTICTCIQNTLESALIISFCSSWRKEKFFIKKVWELCTPSASILRLPETWFVIFKSQRSNQLFLRIRNENKTSEACRFFNMPSLPAPFKFMILRWKTVFLEPIKSSKNMLRKSILIGF